MGFRDAWRANRVLVAVAGLAFLALVATYARDWRLPGLYMDAINPEYLIPGILHPPQPID